jgi:hypothetical protein
VEKHLAKRLTAVVVSLSLAAGVLTGPGATALMVSDLFGQREIGLVKDGATYQPMYPMFLNESNTVTLQLPDPGLVEIEVYSADQLNGAGFTVPSPPAPDWLATSDTGSLPYADYAPQGLPADWQSFLDAVGAPAVEVTGPAGLAFSGTGSFQWAGAPSAGWYYMMFAYAETDPLFDENRDKALFLPFVVTDWAPDSIEELLQLLRDRGYLLNPDGGWLAVEDLYVADPVNAQTGALTWSYTDLTLEGARPLAFTRTYNSFYADDDFGLGSAGRSRGTIG